LIDGFIISLVVTAFRIPNKGFRCVRCRCNSVCV